MKIGRHDNTLYGLWQAYLRSDAVVEGDHAFRPADAGEEPVALVLVADAGRTADDRNRRLGGQVAAPSVRPVLARDADHSRQHAGPVVEVRLVLKHVR